MGIFGDKDKYKVIEKNGRKFLTKNGRRAGSLPGEAEKQAPTASNSLASSSAINEVILGTSEKPAHDYIPLSPGIAEFLATYDDNAPTSQRDLTEPLLTGWSLPEDSQVGNHGGFLDSSNFRDCDPQAILNNIDLFMIAQTMDPQKNLTLTDNGVEVKVGDADFPGNQDYRVIINLNFLDLFTVQRVLVEDGKYTLKGLVDNVYVSDLRYVAKEASMYKSTPLWGN